MDLTYARTMELFRMTSPELLAEYRKVEGVVSEDSPWDDLFHTGIDHGLLGCCPQRSIKEYREIIARENDGHHPAEPGLRTTLIVFEAWMRKKCAENPLIDYRAGLIYQIHVEDDEGVTAQFIDHNNCTAILRGTYLVGSDGGRSQVRKDMGGQLLKEPLDLPSYMVHFKSKELSRIRPFGKYFWHCISIGAGALTNQNDDDIFTATRWYPAGTTTFPKDLDLEGLIAEVLGTPSDPHRVKVDEILVHGPYFGRTAIAERWISEKGHVVLAGDAAHLTTPMAGYEMNSGIEDAYAVGWRLAALLRGYGGAYLLQSYEDEAKPRMARRIRLARILMDELGQPAVQFVATHDVNGDSEEAKKFRNTLKDGFANGGLHEYEGIELDSRYNSAIVWQEPGDNEPKWFEKSYTPSTFPGSRAPHVFLKDGKTSTVDLYGRGLTLFDFSSPGQASPAKTFEKVAVRLGFPLKIVKLESEENVHRIWGKRLVLVRPDGHVAWRQAQGSSSEEEKLVEHVLLVAHGYEQAPSYVSPSAEATRLTGPL